MCRRESGGARACASLCVRARAWGRGRVRSPTPDVTVMATAAPPLTSHFLPPPPAHVPGLHVLNRTHARTHARKQAWSACAQSAGRGCGGGRSSRPPSCPPKFDQSSEEELWAGPAPLAERREKFLESERQTAFSQHAGGERGALPGSLGRRRRGRSGS